MTFYLIKMQSVVLEGFTAPFCSLISHLLAFTNQKAPWCPKRAQHTWKKAKMVTAHFQFCYIPYHCLPAATQYLYKWSGESSLSVILCTFYPLEHNRYPCNKQLPGHGSSVPPRLVTWHLPSESGDSPSANSSVFFTHQLNHSSVMPINDMIQSRTKEPETS